jgi:hypothetical protein
MNNDFEPAKQDLGMPVREDLPVYDVIRQTGALDVMGGMSSKKKTVVTSDTIDGNSKSVIMNLVYPIGTIYTNKTDSRNPAVIFGFTSTWVAREGEVMVGKAPAGTFSSAGALVGAETVVLSTANLAAHNHGDDHNHGAQSGGISANHTHSGSPDNYYHIKSALDGSWAWAYSSNGYQTGTVSSDHSHYTTMNYKSTQGFGTTTANAGSDTAHNNVQPSRVCYIWERTA